MRPPALLPLLLACMTICSCASDPRRGYAFGDGYDDSIRTIHVSLVDNETFSRELGVYLTDAIIKEIRRTTSWRVTDQEYAHTTLSADITNVQLEDYATARTSGLVQEQGVAMTLDFEWKDNRTGKVLVARRNVKAFESFVPSQPVRERLELGENAVIQKMAQQVVAALRSNW